MSQLAHDLSVGVMPGMPQLNWIQDPVPSYIGLIDLPPGIAYEECYQALQHLFMHHDILRIRLQQVDGQRVFSIAPPDEPFILHQAHFAHGLAESNNGMMASKLEEIKQDFTRSNNGYSRFTYISMGSSNYLLILLDHISYDGYALQLLANDFQLCLAQIKQSRPVQLPQKTLSYREWALKMHEYLRSDQAAEHVAYWQGQPWTAVYRIPIDHSRGCYSPGLFQRETRFALGKAETLALFNQARKVLKAPITDLLLSQLLLSLQACFDIGEKAVSITTFVNLRTGVLGTIDASRTLGNFVGTCSVILRSQGNTHPVAMLRSVQAQLQALPLGGKTQGWFLLRNSEEFRIVRSGIALNYLGRVSKSPQAGLPDTQPAPDTPAPSDALPAEEDIRGMMRWPEYVFDHLDPGGAYLLRLHFAELHLTEPGERYFDVWVNQRPAIIKLDIVRLAGARYKAVIQEVPCYADDTGRITLNLVSYRESPGKATISGIELLYAGGPAASIKPEDDSSLLPVVQVNAGGPAAGTFQADQHASRGTANSTDMPIDLTGLVAPAPLAVYQSENYCAIEDETNHWPRLNILCQTRDDCLEFWIVSFDNLHRPETIQALSRSFLDNLRLLIALSR